MNQVGTIRWERREKGGKEKEKERKEKKEEEKISEKLHLLSRIYVGFCLSKRQSLTTRRELRVGRRIRGFRQTPRGRGFSPTLVSLGLRAIY